jgi:DNA-binding NtrC family response regulator
MMAHEPAESGRRTILLVDMRPTVLRRTAELIRNSGHDVIEAASFDDAKRALAARHPSLLISSLRLGAFNGLHLVHLGRLARPDLNAIIISHGADAVLQTEAERAGASLLVEPVPTAAFLGLIVSMLETDALAPACASPRPDHQRGEASQPEPPILNRESPRSF